MFLLAAVHAAGSCARSVCGLLFCLICGGPILLIVGIVILASPNTRNDDIKSYNSAVSAYSGATVATWLPGTIGGETAKSATISIIAKGNTDGVDPASSTILTASVDRDTVPDAAVVFTLTGVDSFSRTPKMTKPYSVGITCSRKSGCTSSTMANNCKSLYGIHATYTGGGCSKKGSCGECQYKAYLNTYCVVVSATKDNGHYSADAKYASCHYPFADKSQGYATSPSATVTFQVRKSDDPYLVLQRITRGSDDFGLTASEQRVLGFVLIGFGVLMILCIAVVAYILYKIIYSFIKKDDPQVSPQQGNNDGYNNNNNNNNNNCGGGGGPGHSNYPQSPPQCQMQPGNYGYGQTGPPPPGPGYGAPPPQQAPFPGQPQQGYPQQQQQQPPPQQGYPYPPQQAQGYPPQQPGYT